MRTGGPVFIDVSDGVSMKPKLGYAVEWPYRMSRQYQHTVSIQQMELIEGFTAHIVALASQPSGLQIIVPESASAMDI